MNHLHSIKHVQVGFLRYAIDWSKKAPVLDGAEVFGYFDDRNQVIRIDSRLSRQKTAEIVWHETSHAVNSHIGIRDFKLPRWTEEEFVGRSTPVWVKVVQDNQRLFDAMKLNLL